MVKDADYTATLHRHISRAIDSGRGLDERDGDGRTALHWAAANGHQVVALCSPSHTVLPTNKSHKRATQYRTKWLPCSKLEQMQIAHADMLDRRRSTWPHVRFPTTARVLHLCLRSCLPRHSKILTLFARQGGAAERSLRNFFGAGQIQRNPTNLERTPSMQRMPLET